MKFPPPISLPRPGSAGFLPAALSGVLLLGLVAQFILPGETSLPPSSGLMPRHQRLAIIPKVGDYPVVKARPLFTPTRQFDEAVTTAAATVGDNGNFVVVGITTGRAAATAFVKNHDGTISALHTGEAHEGWHVAAIRLDRVTFTRSDKRVDVPVGSHGEAIVSNPAAVQNQIAVQGRSETPNPEAEQQAADSTPEEAQQQ